MRSFNWLQLIIVALWKKMNATYRYDEQKQFIEVTHDKFVRRQICKTFPTIRNLSIVEKKSLRKKSFLEDFRFFFLETCQWSKKWVPVVACPPRQNYYMFCVCLVFKFSIFGVASIVMFCHALLCFCHALTLLCEYLIYLIGYWKLP